MSAETLSVQYVRMLLDAVECRGVTRARFLAGAGWDGARANTVEGRVPWQAGLKAASPTAISGRQSR